MYKFFVMHSERVDFKNNGFDFACDVPSILPNPVTWIQNTLRDHWPNYIGKNFPHNWKYHFRNVQETMAAYEKARSFYMAVRYFQ